MNSKSVVRYLEVALGVAVLSLNASSARADRIGNGGVGVVCRTPQGTILEAQMLDIFEGENMDQPLVYSAGAFDADTLVRLATLQMVSNPKFLQDFQNELPRVKANIVKLAKVSTGLTPTNDAFPTLYKKGCAFEQIANHMPDGKIRVDREIYDKLDTLNRAALLVHETIYSVAITDAGETDSIRSRKLTAQVLANNFDADAIQELMLQLVTPPQPTAPAQLPQSPLSELDKAVAAGGRLFRTSDPNLCNLRLLSYTGGDNPVYAEDNLVFVFTSEDRNGSCRFAGQVVTFNYRGEIASNIGPVGGFRWWVSSEESINGVYLSPRISETRSFAMTLDIPGTEDVKFIWYNN